MVCRNGNNVILIFPRFLNRQHKVFRVGLMAMVYHDYFNIDHI